MAKKKVRMSPTRVCEKCGADYHPRCKVCPKCDAPNPTAVSKKPAKKKVAKKTAPKPKAPATGDPLNAAIAFVEKAGGFRAAKKAIETIEKIRQL